MRKKNMCKKIASILVLAAVMVGMNTNPMTAKADSYADEIVYDNENYAITDYWNDDESLRTAPVKDGYVFGGWYSAATEGNALSETEAASATTAYAKFVPAYVLSVKAQIEYAAMNGTAESSFVRVATAVDCNDYQYISFDVWANNTNQVENVPEITTVYNKMTIQTGETTTSTVDPTSVFGQKAAKFAVLKLTNVADDYFSNIIYVRPYWVTMDGTKVEGLAKYIRVEDGFTSNEYISIPVNLMEGQEVAAGIVTVSYADYNGVLQVAKDSDGNYLIDTGRVLPQMSYSVNEETQTITFVANGSSAGEYATDESLYTNIRFQRVEGSNDSNAFYTFKQTAGSFLNWKESAVTVTAWDYQY